MKDSLLYSKNACLEWEILRSLYNLLLLLEAVACPAHVQEYIAGKLPYFGYWGAIVVFLAAANAFFSLGPMLELYGAVFLRKGIGRLRYALFVAGLYISMRVVNPCLILPWHE